MPRCLRQWGLGAQAINYFNEEDVMSPDQLKVMADTIWVLVTAFLVFWMNAGFALVESGLCRAKNAANILGKNFIVFAIASLSFWLIGFGLMFSEGTPYFGLGGLMLGGDRKRTRLNSSHSQISYAVF